MVGPSVSAWLMIVLSRFERGCHWGFPNAGPGRADVLCGLTNVVGCQTFCFSLPGCFVVNYTNGAPGSIEPLRCGGLSASLHRGAGVANQVVFNVGAGQRARDQTTYQQTDARHQQWILFDRLEDRLSRAFREIGRLVA